MCLRKELFSNVELRPKHHYLSHYSNLINEFGILIKIWTLRYESKHTFFKMMVRLLKNFKNITGTLAYKHELYQLLLRSECINADNLLDVTGLTNFDKDIYLTHYLTSDQIRTLAHQSCEKKR